MQESIVFLVRVQCRRKESSRSLSHLLMSFLSLLTGIEPIVSAKLLGVTFSHHVKFIEHVKHILTICN